MQSPLWFDNYINHASQDQFITVEGARISYRTWNQDKNTPQSLLFVHGHAAHNHWWDFIAPAFSDYCVSAMDLSGNGDSDHRSQYSAVTYAKEIQAVAALQANTIVIGHSFGGMMTRIAAYLSESDITSSAKIYGIVLVDSVVTEKKGKPAFLRSLPENAPLKQTRYYQSLEEGMLRFRLKPPQKCPNQYVIDHIAGHSLKKSEQGFSFKVDQGIFAKMLDNAELPSGVCMIQNISCPIGFIYGEQSRFFPKEKHHFLEELIGKDKVVVIPDAAHHVFLDQPQAFIAELKTLLLKLQHLNYNT